MLAINFISSMFVVPITALFVVQIKNLLKNQTTYEMIRAPTKSNGLIKSKMHGKKSNFSFRNCRVMCSDNSAYLTASMSTNDLMDDNDSPSSSSKR